MKKTKRTRSRFSPEDKIKTLHQHLLEKKSVSSVCDEHGITSTQFYGWQKTFFENGAVDRKALSHEFSRDADSRRRERNQLRSNGANHSMLLC
jgi:transposase-like protein